MNPESPTPPPIPLVKEETVKEDGRVLIYYTFPPEAPGGKPLIPGPSPKNRRGEEETTHV